MHGRAEDIETPLNRSEYHAEFQSCEKKETLCIRRGSAPPDACRVYLAADAYHNSFDELSSDIS